MYVFIEVHQSVQSWSEEELVLALRIKPSEVRASNCLFVSTPSWNFLIILINARDYCLIGLSVTELLALLDKLIIA